MVEAKVEAYLHELSQAAPAATVDSHKATLSRFASDCQHHAVTADDLTIEFVGAFITRESESKSSATIGGMIGTLANFLSYLWEKDPEIIKFHLHHAFSPYDSAKSGGESTGEEYTLPTLKNEMGQAVEDVITYLQQRHYGTRTHAFVELLLATASRPGVIRDVDLCDIDRERGTVMIQIPSTHAVSAYNLQRVRTVSLSDQAVNSISMYIDYERVDSREEHREPLFTTSAGRVSAATVRRSLKDVSETALTDSISRANSDEEIPEGAREVETDRPVSPHDIWQYSIVNFIDR